MAINSQFNQKIVLVTHQEKKNTKHKRLKMGKVLPNEPVAKKIEWKQYFERETEPKFTLLKKSRVLEDSTNTNEKIMTDL